MRTCFARGTVGGWKHSKVPQLFRRTRLALERLPSVEARHVAAHQDRSIPTHSLTVEAIWNDMADRAATLVRNMTAGGKIPECLYPQLSLDPPDPDILIWELDDNITLDELDAALGAPLTEAVGADGCRIKNLRHLTRVNRLRLLILLNQVWKDPSGLSDRDKMGRLTLIFKMNGNPEDVRNWRPVTVQPTFTALISKIVNQRLLMTVLMSCSLLSKAQKANIKGTFGVRDNFTHLKAALADLFRFSEPRCPGRSTT